ncbi:MAG: hypothetical protein IJ846_00885 [Alphaproteobacteria bacterium]|nr:hypothetical protein [Alphaproteobacteria bacterium]
MSVSLYEQFLAVGSVKSLVTGKEYPVPQTESAAPSEDRQPSPPNQKNELHS